VFDSNTIKIPGTTSQRAAWTLRMSRECRVEGSLLRDVNELTG